MASAAEAEGHALAGAWEGHRTASRWHLRCDDGTVIGLAVARWLGPAEAADERLLTRLRGPVLDVGCGPGRHVRALAARGVLAVGVDVSPGAVRLARWQGALALQASIFDDIPGTGHWKEALLLDGSIGIGGAPVALLRRVAQLLSADGRLYVEVDGPDRRDRTVRARLEGSEMQTGWFRWALVSARGVEKLAPAAGLVIEDRWSDEGRWFACLSAASRGA